jgi:hypothetical protein
MSRWTTEFAVARAAVLSFGFVLAGCAQDKPPENADGPAEKAGESVDEAAHDTKEGVENAADDVEDKVDNDSTDENGDGEP